MNGVVFLALALVISVIGTIVLWARHRQPADTPDASIEEFRAKMRALSDDDVDPMSGASGGRRGG